MKKTLIIMICVATLFLCSAEAQASGEGMYDNAGELLEAWMKDGGIPDYISGIWSTDGSYSNLTYGVVENEYGEFGKQQILSLVRDDTTVTIVYQKYSRNYLYEIMCDINTYFEKDLGLVVGGIDEYANRIELEIHTDYKDNHATAAMIAELTGKYGDIVCFSYTDSYPEPVMGSSTVAPVMIFGTTHIVANPDQPPLLLGFMLFICAAMIGFLIVLEKRRRLLVIDANGGKATIIRDRVSCKEAAQRVAASNAVVSEELDRRIMSSVCSAESVGNRFTQNP